MMLLNNMTMLLKAFDDAYRWMKEYKMTDELIFETEIHVDQSMILWRDLTLSVIPSFHLLNIILFIKLKRWLEV